jgi:hypothetical protein
MVSVEARAELLLRDFFEVDARFITLAALVALYRRISWSWKFFEEPCRIWISIPKEK